jgi:hypothetical protein
MSRKEMKEENIHEVKGRGRGGKEKQKNLKFLLYYLNGNLFS